MGPPRPAAGWDGTGRAGLGWAEPCRAVPGWAVQGGRSAVGSLPQPPAAAPMGAAGAVHRAWAVPREGKGGRRREKKEKGRGRKGKRGEMEREGEREVRRKKKDKGKDSKKKVGDDAQVPRMNSAHGQASYVPFAPGPTGHRQ